MLTYRTPEYTKSGTTALNRGVKFSDGTMVDGKTKGNLDSGRPNQDASYSTYHWTKSICQTCGTINSVDSKDAYGFSRNVYGLNSCGHNFFLDFDNTTYTPYNESYHTTVLKAGRYCQFCKGTKAKASEKREQHDFSETVDGQIGNNRFFICVGIYAALVNSLTLTSDIQSTLLSVAAYTVVLCFTLFKTGGISKSIFNAH